MAGGLQLTYLFPVLEEGNLKSSYQQSHAPSRGSCEDPSCLFQFLVAPVTPWITASSRQPLPLCHEASVCVCLCPRLLEGHQSVELGPTRTIRDDLITRSLIHCSRQDSVASSSNSATPRAGVTFGRTPFHLFMVCHREFWPQPQNLGGLGGLHSLREGCVLLSGRNPSKSCLCPFLSCTELPHAE